MPLQKINVKNSWSLPLIDHMESLILNNGAGGGKKAAAKPASKPSSKPAGKAGRGAAGKGGRKPVRGGRGDDNDDDDDLEVDMLGESEEEDDEEEDDGGDKLAPLGKKGATGGAAAAGAASSASAQPPAAPATATGSALVSAPSVAYDAAMLNFSRASCALDASVKIYSCRVDDVYATSYRVLDTITRGASAAAAGGKKGAGDDDEGAAGGDGDDAGSDDEEDDEYWDGGDIEKAQKRLDVRTHSDRCCCTTPMPARGRCDITPSSRVPPLFSSFFSCCRRASPA